MKISRILIQKAIIFIYLISLFLPTSASRTGIECIRTNNNKIRWFNTLSNYKQNNRSFNPHNEGFEGNTIAFHTNNMTLLTSNGFSVKDSNYILEMDLSDKNIKEIQDGGFLSLYCLNKLNLCKNKISYLTNETLKSLYNLRELDLSENHIGDIVEGSFIFLGNLKKLNISYNQLKYLNSLSFYHLENLEYLDLSGNEISSVPSATFSNLISLVTLNLEFNRFTSIQPEEWDNLKNLKELNLDDNLLKYFELKRNYSFVNLENLFLTGNKLKHFNIYELSSVFPNLKQFKIDNNAWMCEDLEYVMHALNNTGIDYMGSSYDDENRNGIACQELFKLITSTEPSTTRMITFSSRVRYNHPLNHRIDDGKQKEKVDEDLFKEMNSLKFGVSCLSIVVIVFALYEVIVRCGFADKFSALVGRRRGYPPLDDTSIENFQLISN